MFLQQIILLKQFNKFLLLLLAIQNVSPGITKKKNNFTSYNKKTNQYKHKHRFKEDNTLITIITLVWVSSMQVSMKKSIYSKLLVGRGITSYFRQNLMLLTLLCHYNKSSFPLHAMIRSKQTNVIKHY